MKNTIILLVFSFMMTSCYTTSSLANRIEKKPVVLTKSLLTGLYENQVPDDFENSLWNDLCLHDKDKKKDPASGNMVFLEYKDDKTLRAELYMNKQLVDVMDLPGKPKDHYFVIRKGSHFFTILLVTSKVSRKTILGNDANGDLLLAQGDSNNVSVLDGDLSDDGDTVAATYMRLNDVRPSQIPGL